MMSSGRVEVSYQAWVVEGRRMWAKRCRERYQNRTVALMVVVVRGVVVVEVAVVV